MAALTRNELLRPEVPAQRAMLEAGGEWIADRYADPAEVVAEARVAGVRALRVQSKDITFVQELPELEFLSLGDCGDVSPALGLPLLRSFSALSWEGRLDAAAWPRLEWFGVSEPPRGGGGMETSYGHPTVHSLALASYKESDLRPISAPRLTELALGPAGRLESLAGIEQHADRLEVLSLYAVPKLATLRGIEALARLELFEIEGARLVTTLDDAAKAPALRLLDVFDQKGIESLAPLAGHPTLEFVTFQRTGDMSLDALFEIPNLRLVLGPSGRWNRDIHDLPYMHDMPDEDPRRAGYYQLRLRC